MSNDPFLGRVLTDPATGLPNLPYFRLIRDWEHRRANRRQYAVRVLRVAVTGGDERLRRSLSWHLCRELRTSDLIASEGPGHYRILLTSPDAENVDAIRARIEEIAVELNGRHSPADAVVMHVEVDAEVPPRFDGPCETMDADTLDHSGERPALDSVESAPEAEAKA